MPHFAACSHRPTPGLWARFGRYRKEGTSNAFAQTHKLGDFFMKNRDLRRTVRGRSVAALAALTPLALGVVGLPRAHAAEQAPLPVTFSGLLNDYTPPAPSVTGGPYEMHGRWSLHLNNEQGTATFSAEMTMETADFANTDPNHDPTKLGPHTHHITVTDGMIHSDATGPTNWKTLCPTFKPAVSGGFVVTGTAFVTGNGGNPPFGNPSPVTICILGGAQNPAIAGAQAYVEFSNFTLAFGAGSRASGHFGAQAINGVVAKCARPWGHDSSDCRVEVVD